MEIWSIVTETISTPEFMCHDEHENPLLFPTFAEAAKERESKDEFVIQVKICDGYLIPVDPFWGDTDTLKIPHPELLPEWTKETIEQSKLF